MERYEILKKLGAGTYGTVYLCQQRDTGRQCVMKRMVLRSLSDKERASAHQEAEVLRNLSHPNIVAYVDALATRSKLYLIMQYCDGGDLEQRLQALKRDGLTLPDTQLLDWFVQMTLALQYLHSRRILHRDLKTANVFLTRGGIIKLGDFGVSTVLSATTDLAKTFVGTPYYLSPELLNNQPYGHASDTWALGCIFYEMATLEHPFEAKTFPSLAQKILHDPPPPMAPHRTGKNVRELEELASLMLQKDPMRRSSLPQLLEHEVVQRRMLDFVKEAERQNALGRTKLPSAAPPAGPPQQVCRIESIDSCASCSPHDRPEPQPKPRPMAQQHHQPQPVAQPHPRQQPQPEPGSQPQQQLQRSQADGAGTHRRSAEPPASEAPSSSGPFKRGLKKKRPPRTSVEAEADANADGFVDETPRLLTDDERLAEIERKELELKQQMEELQAAKSRMELAATQRASLAQFAAASNQRPDAPHNGAGSPTPATGSPAAASTSTSAHSPPAAAHVSDLAARSNEPTAHQCSPPTDSMPTAEHGNLIAGHTLAPAAACHGSAAPSRPAAANGKPAAAAPALSAGPTGPTLSDPQPAKLQPAPSASAPVACASAACAPVACAPVACAPAACAPATCSSAACASAKPPACDFPSASEPPGATIAAADSTAAGSAMPHVGARVDTTCTRSLAEWSQCFADRPLAPGRAGSKLAPLSQSSESGDTLRDAELAEARDVQQQPGAAPAVVAPSSCCSIDAFRISSNPVLQGVKRWQSDEAEEYEEDFEADSEGEDEGEPVQEAVTETLRRISNDDGGGSAEQADDSPGAFGSFAAGKGLLELEKTVAKLRLEVAAMGSATDEQEALSSTLKEVASRLSPAAPRVGQGASDAT